MNRRQWLLLLVLADFVALTVWACVEAGGFFEFFAAIPESPVSVLLLVDLTLALTFASVWMFRDARRRGVSVLPYLALTLATGSVGWLLYLIVREGAAVETRAVAQSLPAGSRPA